MSSLFLVRHGQASFGAERYDQLSPLGRRQAAATGEHLAGRDMVFHEAYTGPRSRHRETAAGALSAFRTAPTLLEAHDLDEFAEGEQILSSAERHFAPARAGDATPERKARNAAMLTAWAQGTATIDNCRSAEQFRIAVRDWLRGHRRAAVPGRNTLVFTSAGTIGALLCEVLDLPTARMISFATVINNASITEIAYTAERISLRSFNACAHLPPELLTQL
ncbi:MAG: histidine phosphatase family protein [Steroidobacteraceae bacterium]